MLCEVIMLHREKMLPELTILYEGIMLYKGIIRHEGMIPHEEDAMLRENTRQEVRVATWTNIYGQVACFLIQVVRTIFFSELDKIQSQRDSLPENRRRSKV